VVPGGLGAQRVAEAERLVRASLPATAGALALVLARAVGAAAGAAAPLELLHHVEDPAGTPLATHGAERSVNPASVVKVATTLWALERLGPEHRFVTRFATTGTLDETSGVLDGDLLVLGGGDPDFHVENGFLVARTLNELGLRRVAGTLRVGAGFWIGWEGGSERRARDPRRRMRQMAERLRDALDPARWTPAERTAIETMCRRRGWSPCPTAGVVVLGKPGPLGAPAPQAHERVRHRSNRLVDTLRRLNSFSNNDVERLTSSLGSADELAAWLARRWDTPPGDIRLATLSGLGRNRVPLRLLTRLVRDLDTLLTAEGLGLADVLPSTGCGPGTLESFAGLAGPSLSGAIVAKTGTLRSTDGGVCALAGRVETASGIRYFATAVPRTGGDADRARGLEERWLLDLIAAAGGGRPRGCGALLPFSDTGAEVVAVRSDAP
jgi:D-alanyl-D-alanine carboxypeptidase/D-alanyl-D-alanine-endopeptidase (penicillin-binding protein 4)